MLRTGLIEVRTLWKRQLAPRKLQHMIGGWCMIVVIVLCVLFRQDNKHGDRRRDATCIWGSSTKWGP